MLNRLIRSALSLPFSLTLLTACAPSLVAFERQLVFWPERSEQETPADYGVDHQVIELTSRDGMGLRGWLIPAQAEDPWLIYFHGNANNITGSLTLPMQLKQQLPVNVVMAEYRGYYQNAGVPSEAGLYQDALSFYDFVRDQGVAAEKIILFGFSLGTGVAVQLASELDAGLLILQAPFTSVPDAARWRYGEQLREGLLTNQFDNKNKIAQVNAPLLILHGSDDRSIPIEQGRALFALANEPKHFVAFEGGHNTINTAAISQFGNVIQEISGFIKQNFN